MKVKDYIIGFLVIEGVLSVIENVTDDFNMFVRRSHSETAKKIRTWVGYPEPKQRKERVVGFRSNTEEL